MWRDVADTEAGDLVRRRVNWERENRAFRRLRAEGYGCRIVSEVAVKHDEIDRLVCIDAFSRANPFRDAPSGRDDEYVSRGVVAIFPRNLASEFLDGSESRPGQHGR